MLVQGIGKPEGCKLIRLSADIAGDVIISIRIRGDFFASPPEAFDAAEARLVDIPVAEFAQRFDCLMAEEGAELSGISGRGAALVLTAALGKTHGI
ncbi:hypothetical protein FACS189476_12170 [Spirochaetia bacterium]|nr:hypothetical protein FACS189476_12170 [Spirochaetia bacterium]